MKSHDENDVASGGSQQAWCRDYKGREYSYEEFLKMAEEFHGFGAPGLVIGGAMVGLALRHLPEGCIFNAVCETGKCLPDAIQILTLCSTGNEWMKVSDYGRFALSFYDKYTGEGVRVFLDSSKLGDYPELKNWFFRLVPKKEQNFQLLMKNIRDAHESILGAHRVTVPVKSGHKDGPKKILTCPECGEAYPESDSDLCAACGGESYYSQE